MFTGRIAVAEISAVDKIVSDIMSAIRPALTTAVRDSIERGKEEAYASFPAIVKEATRLLSGLHEESKSDIPIGSVWQQPATERAALGTVKPKVLALVSRDIGASITEIEAIGIKPNSIRGTLYSLQKDGVIRREGDRWYALTPESKEASSDMKEAS
jgi:hypothetical protein